MAEDNFIPRNMSEDEWLAEAEDNEEKRSFGDYALEAFAPSTYDTINYIDSLDDETKAALSKSRLVGAIMGPIAIDAVTLGKSPSALALRRLQSLNKFIARIDALPRPIKGALLGALDNGLFIPTLDKFGSSVWAPFILKDYKNLQANFLKADPIGGLVGGGTGAGLRFIPKNTKAGKLSEDSNAAKIIAAGQNFLSGLISRRTPIAISKTLKKSDGKVSVDDDEFEYDKEFMIEPVNVHSGKKKLSPEEQIEENWTKGSPSLHRNTRESQDPAIKKSQERNKLERELDELRRKN